MNITERKKLKLQLAFEIVGCSVLVFHSVHEFIRFRLIVKLTASLNSIELSYFYSVSSVFAVVSPQTSPSVPCMMTD